MLCLCSLSGAGSLSSGREACITNAQTYTHTLWMRTSGMAFPTTALSLYQHAHTNELIHTAAPSNKLLSFLSQLPKHTLIDTTACQLIKGSKTKCLEVQQKMSIQKVECNFCFSFTAANERCNSKQKLQMVNVENTYAASLETLK